MKNSTLGRDWIEWIVVESSVRKRNAPLGLSYVSIITFFRPLIVFILWRWRGFWKTRITRLWGGWKPKWAHRNYSVGSILPQLALLKGLKRLLSLLNFLKQKSLTSERGWCKKAWRGTCIRCIWLLHQMCITVGSINLEN